ncbi:MAG: hypothetical protein MK214_11715 [Thalassotalea sp.]|nr:hypothetical protein [Thalassotalea sp.]
MGPTLKFLWHGGAAIFWLGLLIGIPVLLLPLLMMSGCETTEHEIIPSPNKESEAAVLIVNCGATTNWETQVVVRDKSNIDNHNVLIRLDGHPETTEFNVRWRADNTIEITEFKFEDLLSFHSRNLNGDITRSIIRPKVN